MTISVSSTVTDAKGMLLPDACLAIGWEHFHSIATVLHLELPFVVEHVELALAASRGVELASNQPNDEIPLLIHDIFAPSTWRVNIVGIQELLRHESQFGENGRMPLHNVFLDDQSACIAQTLMVVAKNDMDPMAYQSVPFGLLEVVAPIQWVKPGVKEEFGPFTSPEDEAALA